jgi:hypothetical protein
VISLSVSLTNNEHIIIYFDLESSVNVKVLRLVD